MFSQTIPRITIRDGSINPDTIGKGKAGHLELGIVKKMLKEIDWAITLLQSFRSAKNRI